MKKIIVALITLAGLNAQAGTYDHQVLTCKDGTHELAIQGKKSLFSGRQIMLKKSGKVVINESYTEEEYLYSDKNGSSRPDYFDNIVRTAYKLRPRSIHQDMDHRFLVSDNAIVMQTYDNLTRAYGGESSLILVEISDSNQILVFDRETQCSSKAL